MEMPASPAGGFGLGFMGTLGGKDDILGEGDEELEWVRRKGWSGRWWVSRYVESLWQCSASENSRQRCVGGARDERRTLGKSRSTAGIGWRGIGQASW